MIKGFQEPDLVSMKHIYVDFMGQSFVKNGARLLVQQINQDVAKTSKRTEERKESVRYWLQLFQSSRNFWNIQKKYFSTVYNQFHLQKSCPRNQRHKRIKDGEHHVQQAIECLMCYLDRERSSKYIYSTKIIQKVLYNGSIVAYNESLVPKLWRKWKPLSRRW